MDLVDGLDDVRTRDDLIGFLGEAVADLSRGGAGWENTSLEDFLEALAAWLQDMPGVFANRGQPVPNQPDWNLVARMIMAARMYE
ncbi:hypothetical protein AB0P17_36330 [Streptomyces sp. NPDC088124]|uniref:DUF7660 family protein n=1 Tax=Streptomyces sp. NPDC088124 TaxID=3154654 RepID=UPI0034434ADA